MRTVFKLAAQAALLSLLSSATLATAAALPPRMQAIIPIGGGGLFAKAINEAANEVYEFSNTDKKLYIIDGQTDKVKDAIAFDFGAQGMDYYRAANQILLVNMGKNTLHLVDRKTKRQVGAPIPIPGLHATKVAVDQGLGKAYVTSMHGGTVAVVNLKNRAVVANIVIGTGGATPPGCDPWSSDKPCTTQGAVPLQVAVNQKTHRVYVGSYLENHITVIDGATHQVVGARIPVGSQPNGLGINEKTNKLYVANWQDGTVSVIDGATNRLAATIPVGYGPQKPAHCYEAGVITACDAWGSMPLGPIGVNEAANQAYVANSNDGTISVIDGAANKVLGKPVPVTTGKLVPDGCYNFGVCTRGSAASGVLYNRKTGKMYVESAQDKWISVVEAAPKLSCVQRPNSPGACF